MLVRWGESLCNPFTVCNGVKQGRILSLLLSNVYMNDLSINNTNIEGQIGDYLLNHLCYFDDLALVSISSRDMQQWLDTCKKYAVKHDLLFNSSKTKYMFYTPKGFKLAQSCFILNSKT